MQCLYSSFVSMVSIESKSSAIEANDPDSASKITDKKRKIIYLI